MAFKVDQKLFTSGPFKSIGSKPELRKMQSLMTYNLKNQTENFNKTINQFSTKDFTKILNS